MMRLESKGQLGVVDAIVFDCDGVLIDARGSDDASILRTTETGSGQRLCRGDHTTRRRRGGGRTHPAGPEDRGLQQRLGHHVRTHAPFAVAALTAKGGEGVLFPPGDGARMTWAIDRLKGIVKGFSSRERLAGWREVDATLADEGLESETIEKLRAESQSIRATPWTA